MIKFVMTKARIKRPSYKHMDIYIYIQGRIQDLAQGWGRGGTEFKRKGKILHHLLNEFTRKYQEKNLCPPPESLRGGTFWLSPPWIAQAGDNSQGGDSPPPEIAQGGDSPLFPPPCIRSWLCIYIRTYLTELSCKIRSNFHSKLVIKRGEGTKLIQKL